MFLKKLKKNGEDFNFEKRRKLAKYDFLESPPNYYTGVRIPTKIQKDIFAFFEEFLKSGPVFLK